MKKSKQNYNFLKIHLQLKKYANFIHYFNLNDLRKEWWDTDGLNNLYYKLRESNLLREKKKMQNVTTPKVWFSRRRERIGKKVRNLLSAKGREIWMDVLRKTKHRPNEMVIGVETKLKKKKKRVGRGGGGGSKVWTGERRRSVVRIRRKRSPPPTPLFAMTRPAIIYQCE